MLTLFELFGVGTAFPLESSAGRVDPHCYACGCGAGPVDKFFVRVTEFWAKAHEINQLENRETRGCSLLKLFASIALRTVAGLSQMQLQKSLEQYQKIPKISKSVVVQHKIGVRMINVKNRTKYHLQNKLK